MYRLIISVNVKGEGYETVLDRTDLSSCESEKLIKDYRAIYGIAKVINIHEERIVTD